MKKSAAWLLCLIFLLSFSSPAFSVETDTGGGITSGVKNSANDIIETILEQFLEAGQLIWIQIQQLVDPGDLGFSVALHNHLDKLQQNPVAMAGVGLAAVGIPLLVYRMIQTRRRRREELQELKEALEEDEEYEDEEDEDYDYEEEFKKLHASDEEDREDQDEEDELEDYEEEEEEEEEEEKDKEKEEAEQETEEEPVVTKTAEEESSEKEEEIGVAMEPVDEDEAEITAAMESVDDEETAVAMESVVDEVKEEIEITESSGEPAPAIAQNSFENIANVSDEESEDIVKQLEQQFSILESEFREVDDFLEEESQNNKPGGETETVEATSLPNEEEADQPEPVTSSIEEEEMDEELSSLQEEMERTISEISQQLAEDETLVSNISIDTESEDQEIPVIEDITVPETSADQVADLTAEDFLKAIGGDEPATVPESIEEPDKSDEDEEYLNAAERLLQEMDEEPEETPIPEIVTAKEEPEPETAYPEPPPTPTPEQNLSIQEEPESVDEFPEIPRVEPPPRKTVSPVKARSYLSRLETFQKRLEGRIRHLESDSMFPVPETPPQSTIYYDRPPVRKTSAGSPAKRSWPVPEGKRKSKKAYSLDVLESLLFLESQKK